MNLIDLQAELRHFAAERDWQRFHTPKNLSTALMVEAAELAEVFQWMTPEQSQAAHREAATQQRIGDEVADVMLYLLQLADHSQIDLERAVRGKLARNALKHPAKHQLSRALPAVELLPGTHVLLDFENVQPTAAELRAMVPDATRVWVFHGPHQRLIAKRFESFGADMTAVQISQVGKNALDFHLSFYMGYIASRNQQAQIVVVANDKGYEPMLRHAKAMGFDVRQIGFSKTAARAAVKKAAAAKPRSVAKPAVKSAAKPPVAKKTAARKVAAKTTPAKTTPAKADAAIASPAKKAITQKPATRKPAPQKAQAPAAPAAKAAAKKAPAKKAPAKKVPAKKTAAKTAATTAAGARVAEPAARQTTQASKPPAMPPSLQKLTENLRKMGVKRPTKQVSLRRLLKSFLGASSSDLGVEDALGRLRDDGVLAMNLEGGVLYPKFEV